jgi:surface polysaccharide O-acyltransferase-like enzyme
MRIAGSVPAFVMVKGDLLRHKQLAQAALPDDLPSMFADQLSAMFTQ